MAARPGTFRRGAQAGPDGRRRAPGTPPPSGSRRILAEFYCDRMHLLHIAHRADWQEALRDGGRYTVSTRGHTLDDVGYVHASYPEQVDDVARYVYRDDPEELCVLVLEPALIRQDGVRVEHEDGGNGELFPHIYGPIERSWVVDVRPARFDDRGRFVY